MAEVVCSICGKTSSKGKTYSVGDGKRACREHEGVADIKESLEEKRQQALAWEEEKKQRDRQRKQDEHDAHTVNLFKPKCLICHQVGIQERDFYAQLLIHSKKEELKGNGSALMGMLLDGDSKHVRDAFGLKDGEKLNVLSWFDAEKNAAKLTRMPVQVRQLANLVSGIVCCQKCALQHGFEKYQPPMPSLETLSFIGAGLDESLTKIAKEQIEKESIG